MNCKRYSKHISPYIDGELKTRTKNRLISHLKRCHNCRQEYGQLLEIKNMLNRVDQQELPDGFNQKLHLNLVKEADNMYRGKSPWRIVVGAVSSILVVLIIFLGIQGILPKTKNADKSQSSAVGKGDMAAGWNNYSGPEIGEEVDYDYGDSDAVGTEELKGSEKERWVEDSVSTDIDEAHRKLIRTAHLVIETLEFDRTVSGLHAKTDMLQGYVESSSIEGISRYRDDKSKRHADLTIRIPTENLEEFTASLDSIGDITHREIYGKDITAQYFDTEARLKSLNIQEERLLKILSKAEKLQDIIEVERELSKVRYEIENYTGTLKKWDNLVDYSTVHISVREVEQLNPVLDTGFGEKVSRGFMRSIKTLGKFFENLFASIIIWSPYILIIGVLLWSIKIFIIDRKRKGRDKNE